LGDEYEESFMRHEITGHKFICMDEHTLPAAAVDDVSCIQTAKLVAHAESLRGKVFDRAHVTRPLEAADWSPVHVAAWLQVNQDCPNSALCAYRAQIDGELLL
jgi:hypothetical protein